MKNIFIIGNNLAGLAATVRTMITKDKSLMKKVAMF
jgi:hypothetical protein